MVTARSAAEIPVVTPFLASMEMVNPVPNLLVLSLTMSGRSSLSTISASSARQMSPLPNLAMKLMESAVTNSAAMVRSPSFSRPSSSTRMIILPFLISARASSTVHVGMLLLLIGNLAS